MAAQESPPWPPVVVVLLPPPSAQAGSVVAGGGAGGSAAGKYKVGENGDGSEGAGIVVTPGGGGGGVGVASPTAASAVGPAASASPVQRHLPLPLQLNAVENYPAAAMSHEEVISDQKVFLETFYKFHTEINSKPTIPKMGGKDLDVHLLYKEVTGRGGLQQVIRDRKWKEITGAFKFPRTTTSASYVLRKYYIALLHHFEQVYYFGTTGSLIPPPINLPQPSPSIQPGDLHPFSDSGEPIVRKRARKRKLNATALVQADPGDIIGTSVTGSIEGKMDFGYLVTMNVGGEKLRGILYHVPPGNKGPQFATVPSLVSSMGTELSCAGVEIHTRRKRRRKEEMPKKDPNAPRPNRTGYNFFFAEQRQALKMIHPDKDREISRMIGEKWNGLTEDEKIPYQDRGVKDKERFKKEMRDYRERQKNGDLDANASSMKLTFHERNDQQQTKQVATFGDVQACPPSAVEVLLPGSVVTVTATGASYGVPEPTAPPPAVGQGAYG